MTQWWAKLNRDSIQSRFERASRIDDLIQTKHDLIWILCDSILITDSIKKF